MKLNSTLTQNILLALCGNRNTGTDAAPKSDVSIGSYKNCWLGLFHGEPTEGGVELSGRGYERINVYEKIATTYQSYTLGETSNTAHQRRIGNKEQIAFPEAIKSNILVDAEAGGRWETATHWAIFNSQNASVSSALAWGELDEPITVDTHQIFIIRKGHLELYMEPDNEYIYYGFYDTEANFIAAIRAKEEVEDDSQLGTLGRESLTERKTTVTGDATDKFLFYAYPVDFKGSPLFRDTGTINEFDDKDYVEYLSQRSSSAPIFKSYYKTTTSDNTKVVMADRSNAYYVHRVYGIKDSYVPCGTTQPSDWAINWKLYYTHYFPVRDTSAPTFIAGAFYSYNDGAYTALDSAPQDWATNWRDYYTYNTAAYNQVKDSTCPTFAGNTYYGLTPITGSVTINVL